MNIEQEVADFGTAAFRAGVEFTLDTLHENGFLSELEYQTILLSFIGNVVEGT